LWVSINNVPVLPDNVLKCLPQWWVLGEAWGDMFCFFFNFWLKAFFTLCLTSASNSHSQTRRSPERSSLSRSQSPEFWSHTCMSLSRTI
jgi:hypothetical protein